MAPALSAPLNAEPSLPDERKENQLPPKTYSDAAHEGLSSHGSFDSDTASHYVGEGENDAPRSPARRSSKKNGSLRVNGMSKKSSSQSLLVERYRDRSGERLTSVQSDDFDEGLRQDEKEKSPPKQSSSSELVSGRRAGAGWERSG